MNFDTQDAAIEKLLRSRYGEWIPCYELADLALQYCRAIHSIRTRLRQAGDVERVVNKVERVNGKAHGSYRIVRTADITPSADMEDTLARVERDDFYSSRGVQPAMAGTPDWFERSVGVKRPGSETPPSYLGPLFETVTNG